MNVPLCLAEGKSMKPEPGEVTSPPHPSNKKDDSLKRERDNQDMNDSDEEEEDEEEEGDLLEEEEVRFENGIQRERNEYVFFGGDFLFKFKFQIQHWTDLPCASCGIKHQTRLGWVRVGECVSVSVYMRVCIRCPFNQLSESQQEPCYYGSE